MTAERRSPDPIADRRAPGVKRLRRKLAKHAGPVVASLPAARRRVEGLSQQGHGLLARADALTHGVVGVLWTAAQGFTAVRALTGAAAVTYYALLSLPPLLITIVAVASLVFGRDRAVEQLSAAVAAFVPVGQEFLQRALATAVISPGAFPLVAIGVLLWGATGFLAELQYHANRAWESLGGRPSTLRERGRAALIVFLLLIALILLITINYVVAPMAALLTRRPLLSAVGRGIATPLVQWLMLWAVAGCLVFVAYLQVPGVRVWRRAALLAALLVSLVWQLAGVVVGWFVNSGLANYEFWYGSLSAVIALLAWLYVSAVIILAGAHLAAAIQGRWAPAAKPQREEAKHAT